MVCLTMPTCGVHGEVHCELIRATVPSILKLNATILEEDTFEVSVKARFTQFTLITVDKVDLAIIRDFKDAIVAVGVQMVIIEPIDLHHLVQC